MKMRKWSLVAATWASLNAVGCMDDESTKGGEMAGAAGTMNALLDVAGDPRDPEDVAADLRRSLTSWDAGTEANEVIGVGPNQGPRQSGSNVGPPDPNDSVRLYDDSTNDLAQDKLGELLSVTIAHTSGSTFEVTVSNTSGASACQVQGDRKQPRTELRALPVVVACAVEL